MKSVKKAAGEKNTNPSRTGKKYTDKKYTLTVLANVFCARIYTPLSCFCLHIVGAMLMTLLILMVLLDVL